ncbi:MAG: porin family protein [Bacteroidota bacterium]
MRITMLSAIVLLSFHLKAQVDSLTTFEVGLSFGQSFSTVDFSLSSRPENVYSSRTGVDLGIGLRYFNLRAAGFAAELNYVGGGWQETTIELDSITGDTIASNLYARDIAYIEAQILTQFAFGRKLIRPILQAGPYLAIPIRDKEIFPADFTLPEDDTYFGRSLGNRLNYGLTIGLGLYIALERIGIQLEGRARFGLVDLVPNGTNGISTSRRQGIGWRATAWYSLH